MTKIAIFSDELSNKGGIERQIMDLGKYFDIDIYCGKYNEKTTFEAFKDYNITQLAKKLPYGLNMFYLRYKFNKLCLRGYDVYIFFGAHSWSCPLNTDTST